LEEAFSTLPQSLKASWIWWHLPIPSERVEFLADVIEDEPIGVEWHKPEETAYLLSLMSELHLRQLHNAQSLNRRIVGTIYRRMRTDKNGQKKQRAELRLDGISGCLRTPVGGSSRQTLLIIEGEHVRSRLMAPREAARMMGLPETYKLPAKYNDAYYIAGDGLVVPVVSWLETHLLWSLAVAPLNSAEAA
jgi:DNA (cytosine-5)-methyltransferase 1